MVAGNLGQVTSVQSYFITCINIADLAFSAHAMPWSCCILLFLDAFPSEGSGSIDGFISVSSDEEDIYMISEYQFGKLG